MTLRLIGICRTCRKRTIATVDACLDCRINAAVKNAVDETVAEIGDQFDVAMRGGVPKFGDTSSAPEAAMKVVEGRDAFALGEIVADCIDTYVKAETTLPEGFAPDCIETEIELKSIPGAWLLSIKRKED